MSRSMDIHQTHGTSISIAKVLHAHVVDGFAYEGPEQEPVGLICEIDETSTEALQKRLKISSIFLIQTSKVNNMILSKSCNYCGMWRCRFSHETSRSKRC